MSTKNKESMLNALDMLEKEKGIPKAYMLEKIEVAMLSAYHKEYGANARVRSGIGVCGNRDGYR